jgi:hypothetical protein
MLPSFARRWVTFRRSPSSTPPSAIEPAQHDWLDAHNDTSHSLVASNVPKHPQSIDVRVMTLDEHLGELQLLDLIKIDAQGADLRVLRGAQRLIRRFQPAITIEFWPSGLRNMGDEPLDLIAELKGSGNDVYRLSAEGLLESEEHVTKFLARAGRWSSINLAAEPREMKRARGQ